MIVYASRINGLFMDGLFSGKNWLEGVIRFRGVPCSGLERADHNFLAVDFVAQADALAQQ